MGSEEKLFDAITGIDEGLVDSAQSYVFHKQPRTWQRIASLAACLLIGLLPTSALAAGTDTGKAIKLGTSGISGYDSTNGYDYIYYGEWNSSPIKWRVLDDQTNTGDDGLFLLSDVLFGTGPSGGGYFDNPRRPYSHSLNGSDAPE